MSERNRIAVVEDIRFRAHRAPKGHPESPERLLAVSRVLAEVAPQIRSLPPRAAESTELLRVHTAGHLRAIERAAARAPAHLDPDTYVSAESEEVARLAAGSAIDLACRVARGKDRFGLAAIRPPGHHAEADRAMGFCLFNNAAIAARALLDAEGLERVLIIDWDVHHGNGTQHAFETDPRVLYFSIHQFPNYPGSGDFGEIGSGAGRGHTLNVPLPAGCGNVEYRGVFERVLVPVAHRYRPELILVSCGFDAHRDDPLASMELDADGYLELTREVRRLARDLCGERLVFLLEGGYAERGLEQGTRAVLRALLEEPPPGAAPSEVPAGSTLRQILDHISSAHADSWPGAIHGA